MEPSPTVRACARERVIHSSTYFDASVVGFAGCVV
jgi:hypothetical protein